MGSHFHNKQQLSNSQPITHNIQYHENYYSYYPIRFFIYNSLLS